MPEWILRDSRLPGMVLHPSTEGALLALKELAGTERFSKILDIGCGSGLLSLVSAELWPEARILAADISEQAVQDAEANIRQYGLEGRIAVLRGNGFKNPRIAGAAPYSLILCNLLAELLVRIGPEVKSHLAPGGYAVLSGVLSWMYPQVTEAYQTLGFEIAGEIEMGEWKAVIVHLPAKPS
jgi:ribosomal protein L11 methyltransferase